MAVELQNQVKDLGFKLQRPPSDQDALIDLLQQAGGCLAKLAQSQPALMLELMQPLLNAIASPELLNHHDKDVKLLVATCICEIYRITAPEAPYNDDILRDMFCLIVSTFVGLSDISSPSFGRQISILQTLARFRSCVVMLDLECDDLVNEMFGTFFAVVSDDHPESVMESMQMIMVVLLEESEDIHEDLLFVILSVLGQNKNDAIMAPRRLALKVIENSAAKLEPGIKQFLIRSITRDSKGFSSQIDYHEVIYDVYSCAPQILSGVIPYLTKELLRDQIDTRMKAMRLVGALFAQSGSITSEVFQPIFTEFLKRLTDTVVEIQMSVLEHVKIYLLSNPLRVEAPQIISALCDRLLDNNENVRKQVVVVVCDVICQALTSIPVEIAKLVSERLEDKSLLIKKYTMERLVEIHKLYFLKFLDGSITTNKFDWIPGKILRCMHDSDFRSDTIESLLCGSLFPTEFSVKDKVKQWIRVFSTFDKVEIKAFEKILEQKQRLQHEMHRYLYLQQTYQDTDTIEFQKKIQISFRIMSRCFTEPMKAEENFQTLHQLKDTDVEKILSALLDPNTTFIQASSCRDDLIKKFGEKHSLFDFLNILSMKCSYLLFNKEYVKEILLEASRQKTSGCTQLTLSCMNFLVILAHYSPSLLNGTEENLVHLLKDDDDLIKEGILNVFAKAGGSIQEQLGVSSSSLELMLEKICVEGNRRQAKYAVHALGAVTKDNGLKSLSVLYKRLVDMLKEKMHLPAMLQSLGCIAQIAMPVFETRESEIEEFIKSKILECNYKMDDNEKESWEDRSELCSLKIFGIKTLVKSYLPVKDAHLRLGIDKLMGILKSILSFGEILPDIKSSSVDKAHLRLAAAKAILRLSRHWDYKIPIDIFHLTLRTPEINFPQAKKIFLNKVYQYIKDRTLDAKYSCAFLFSMLGFHQSNFEEGKQNFCDIIQTCQQIKAYELPIQSDTNSQMAYPENIIPYVVHALAHHSSCPDVEKSKDVKDFELIYRQLHFFLSTLVHVNDKGMLETSSNNERSISAIDSIFQSINHSEDVINTEKSKNSHAICDFALSILKRLIGKENGVPCLTASVSLPPMLYKPLEKKDDADELIRREKSWLADDSIISHLESLTLDITERARLEPGRAENLKNNEGCGNEVPLGKMLKHLKVQGLKTKKVMKNRHSFAGAKNAGNNVGILKMVREINLDNLGISTEFESANGHEKYPRKSKIDKKHQIKKTKKGSDAMIVPVPKRRRSFSAHAALRFSHQLKNSKGLLKDLSGDLPQIGLPFQSSEMEFDIPASLEGKSANGMGIVHHKIYNVEAGKGGRIDDLNLKKIVLSRDMKEPVNNLKSTTMPVKKRKRSLVGLSKCSTKETGNHTTDLVDCRIKVWWPMDNQFYEGVVKSYDFKKKKHVVLYDDGDQEFLYLEKERWELIESDWKSGKMLNPSKSTSEEPSPELLHKISGSSRQSKKSNNMVRKKRTPRKNWKQNGKKVSDRKTGNIICGAEIRTSSDVSAPESGPIHNVDELNLGEEIEGGVDREAVVANKKSLGYSDADEPDTEIKMCLDKSKPSGLSFSGEEADEEEHQTDNAQSSLADTQESDDYKALHYSEASDNETLGTWKRQHMNRDKCKVGLS